MLAKLPDSVEAVFEMEICFLWVFRFAKLSSSKETLFQELIKQSEALLLSCLKSKQILLYVSTFGLHKKLFRGESRDLS
jgi:hypothetical protein